MKDRIRVSSLGPWGGGRRTCLHTQGVSSCLSGVTGGGEERAPGLKIVPAAAPARPTPLLLCGSHGTQPVSERVAPEAISSQ